MVRGPLHRRAAGVADARSGGRARFRSLGACCPRAPLAPLALLVLLHLLLLVVMRPAQATPWSGGGEAEDEEDASSARAHERRGGGGGGARGEGAQLDAATRAGILAAVPPEDECRSEVESFVSGDVPQKDMSPACTHVLMSAFHTTPVGKMQVREYKVLQDAAVTRLSSACRDEFSAARAEADISQTCLSKMREHVSKLQQWVASTTATKVSPECRDELDSLRGKQHVTGNDLSQACLEEITAARPLALDTLEEQTEKRVEALANGEPLDENVAHQQQHQHQHQQQQQRAPRRRRAGKRAQQQDDDGEARSDDDDDDAQEDDLVKAGESAPWKPYAFASAGLATVAAVVAAAYVRVYRAYGSVADVPIKVPQKVDPKAREQREKAEKGRPKTTFELNRDRRERREKQRLEAKYGAAIGASNKATAAIAKLQ